MKKRMVVCLVAFLSLCGVAAQAQETPKVDVFAGYSYVRANPGPNGGDSFSLNGGEASVTYHFRDWVSGVADFGGYHNGDILGSGVDGTLSTYLFGPRFSYRSYHHFTPFAETLLGVAHAGAGVAGGTAWLVAELVRDGDRGRRGLSDQQSLLFAAAAGRLFVDAVFGGNPQ